MGNPVARMGDKSTGHDACPPTDMITASQNVFINGKGCGRLNDKFAAHACDDHASHNDSVIRGSNTVFVNGLPIARKGDPLTLAGNIAQGSNNVFAG